MKYDFRKECDYFLNMGRKEIWLTDGVAKFHIKIKP